MEIEIKPKTYEVVTEYSVKIKDYCCNDMKKFKNKFESHCIDGYRIKIREERGIPGDIEVYFEKMPIKYCPFCGRKIIIKRKYNWCLNE